MNSYQMFIFESYSLDPEKGRIELKYGLDEEVRFTETLQFPPPLNSLPPAFAKATAGKQGGVALFALHLIGGISYYKTCCPKTIEVRSGHLSKEQAEFWNTVYEKGLGEFWYKNGMDFRGIVQFPCKKDTHIPSPWPSPAGGGKTLIPIGGGKDSIVTLEVLRKKRKIHRPPLPNPPPEGEGISLFRMNSHPIIDQIAHVANLPLLNVERRLDPQLFALNTQGALNGHIPITCYLSCLCAVVAELYGFDEIAMSAEKSASEGNIEHCGTMINHQWSKSEEFEQMFQRYIRTFINPHLKYWSPIRHMTELAVVKEFAKYPQYWKCTTSCNKNWKILSEKSGLPREALRKKSEVWCGECPKCAFVFALYAAHLPKEKVLEIFGQNLFEKPELISTYRQLLGLEGCKPFECVGTPKETREAFKLAEQNGFTVPHYAHS